MKKISVLLVALLCLSCARNEVKLTCDQSTVRLQVISPEIVRVSESPDGKFHSRKSLVVLPQKGQPNYTVTRSAEGLVLETEALKVQVNKADGSVNFY